MANQTIIEANGLTKRFTVKKTTVEAVTDLTFTVGRGELVAFLGPNGAGKSTSLRMLTTLLPPTSGTASVVGFDVRRSPAEVRARIGYVGQLTSGSFAQRARDELLSQGAFYGMSKRASRARADELIESLDLAGFAGRSVQQLSGGQKRRLDIALGLMHAPPLIFLDEPSTGLDPQSRANLWQHILDLRAEHGTTIFLTTHYLDEADRYAERVMVMDRGRVIADDTAARLKAELAGDAVTFGFATPLNAAQAEGVLARLTDREVRRIDQTTLQLTAPDGDRLLPEAVRALDAAGIAVRSASGVPPTLDDVFLALTGRTLREAGEGNGADADQDEGQRESAGKSEGAGKSEAAGEGPGAIELASAQVFSGTPATTQPATAARERSAPPASAAAPATAPPQATVRTLPPHPEPTASPRAAAQTLPPHPETSVRANPVRDAWHVLTRELRPFVRDPFSLIFNLLQPLVFLGLFGPLLVGASGEPVADTLQWFVPGVLVMIVLFGTGTVGSNLQYEMMTGSHERTLVAPLSRSSLLVGRALKEVAPIAVQAVIIVLIAWPFGFRADVPGLVIGLALLAVFGIGLGALSYALALQTKDREWLFWGVQQTLIFPLLILSGMLLPLDDGPAWMRVVASINPLNWVVQAERALLAGELADVTVLWGWVAALVLAAVGLVVGIRAMRRSS